MCDSNTLSPLSVEASAIDDTVVPEVELGRGCRSARLLLVGASDLTGTFTWALEESPDGAAWVPARNASGTAITGTTAAGAITDGSLISVLGIARWRIKTTNKATTGRYRAVVARAGDPAIGDNGRVIAQ